MWINIDTEERTIEFRGKPLHVEVSIDVADEQDDVEGDFDFGDAAENAEYLARFRSGELSAVCIRVTATALGEEGTDYLGMCHVHTGRQSDVLEQAQEYEMVDRACEDLVSHLESRVQRLGEYLSNY